MFGVGCWMSNVQRSGRISIFTLKDKHKRLWAEGVAQTFLSAVPQNFYSAGRGRFERFQTSRRLPTGKSAIQQTGMSALRLRVCRICISGLRYAPRIPLTENTLGLIPKNVHGGDSMIHS